MRRYLERLEKFQWGTAIYMHSTTAAVKTGATPQHPWNVEFSPIKSSFMAAAMQSSRS